MTSKDDKLYQLPTIKAKASIKDKTTSSLQSSKAKVGEVSHQKHRMKLKAELL
jgi:hypothetical protein